MNEQYMEVPTNILTGKDMDYLSDMFEWNYAALKKSNEGVNNVNDAEILNLLERGKSIFDSNLTTILEIFNEKGGSCNGK